MIRKRKDNSICANLRGLSGEKSSFSSSKETSPCMTSPGLKERTGKIKREQNSICMFLRGCQVRSLDSRRPKRRLLRID